MEKREVMPYVEPRLILDYMGINLDGSRAVHEHLTFGIDTAVKSSHPKPKRCLKHCRNI